MNVQELEGVREMLRQTDLALAGPVDQARANFAGMLAGLPEPDGVTFEQTTWAGLPATTTGDPLRADAVLLYLHGGAFAVGSGWGYRPLWGALAQAAQATGLAIDYRMAPEDAFPAAVEDAVAAYRSLVDQGVSPARIALAGDSAGGGLAVSTLVAIRDAGLPLPATAVAISPWADLACAGASMTGKADEDLSLDADDLRTLAARYLDGSDANDPLASPINADLTGLPPLLIQVGSAELLLDDAVRLAGRAHRRGPRAPGRHPRDAACLAPLRADARRGARRHPDGRPVAAGAPGMTSEHYDAVVVGAGFAGLYALKRLRDDVGLNTIALEAGSGVGGTWYWNRYPGARCDVESLDYQYSFSSELVRDWQWSQRYAPQEEILRYLQHVAERFDLNRDIALDTRVTAAHFDEGDGTWTVTTDTGRTLVARFVVMATGCLSVPKAPEVEGTETFRGTVHHTARWPHDGVDFSGQRVAVIGTGSSGIQVIPQVARQAAEVTVFQRTPNFIMPAHNAPLDPDEARAVVDDFEQRRKRIRESATCLNYPEGDRSALEVSDAERERELEERWAAGGLNMIGVFTDVMVDADANEHVAEFFRRKIAQRVEDPATAQALTPRGYPWGTKRLCVETEFYETFNEEHVRLVDLRVEPLQAIVPDGVQTSARTYPADAIVFATGFDAMTGALLAMDIRGRGDERLADHWAGGPRTYLGIAVSGFPNLFLVTGPGSPSVFSNMVVSIEQHVDWIADLLATGVSSVEATAQAEDAWVDHVNLVADSTLVGQADSWYIGANVPGKPRVFMPYLGGVGPYRALCDEVAANAYDGFATTGNR